MMLRRRPNGPRRRRGMTIVESALVLGIFMALLFGIFEYCRFLFMLHVANNAARDGSRYAVVNVSKPTNFDTTDYTDPSGTVYPSIQKYTTTKMAGLDKQLGGYAVAVFACDPAGLSAAPPVVRPKTPAAGWNNAAFTERIAVQITGTYTPVTPLSISNGRTTIALFPSTIPLTVTSIMGSEG